MSTQEPASPKKHGRINLYILLDKSGQQIPHMQDLDLDVLIRRFARTKIREFELDTKQAHQIWHMYSAKGWRYIEVFAYTEALPEGTSFVELE